MRPALATCLLMVLYASLAAASSMGVVSPLDDPWAIVPTVIDSPPPDISHESVASLTPDELMASKTLSGVPAAYWWYGCTATSAGMLFGYYDNHGYSNMFAGDIVGNIDTLAERDLIATQAHRTDYWTGTANSPDPWVTNGWTEHTWSTCTGDFMGTSQWKWDTTLDGNTDYNTDGGTLVYTYPNGAPLYNYAPNPAYGLPQTECAYGMKLFAESRGYSVAYENGNYQNYNQRIYTPTQTLGFTYAQYMAEIDAGRPVLLHVTGHTMLGYGYNNDTTNQVILYDTWDYLSHQMTWGGAYSGRDHLSVTVVKLDPLAAIPEPGTFCLFGLGLAGIVIWRRRRAA